MLEKFMGKAPEVAPGAWVHPAACLIGAVVTPGSKIPPRSMVMGAPGKVKRSLTDEECAGLVRSEKEYIELAGYYRTGGAK